MKTVTSRERFIRMFNHQEADRIPVIEYPWKATVERWHREGMPADVSVEDFFDMDKVAEIRVDTTPQYPVEVVEETEEYQIRTTSWGVTMRNWRHAGGTPEYLDFTIVDRESWEEAKKRITLSRSRIPFDKLKRDYPTWKEQGQLIVAVPSRGMGKECSCAAHCSGETDDLTISVSMSPGQTALTVMPCGASSLTMARGRSGIICADCPVSFHSAEVTNDTSQPQSCAGSRDGS